MNIQTVVLFRTFQKLPVPKSEMPALMQACTDEIIKIDERVVNSAVVLFAWLYQLGFKTGNGKLSQLFFWQGGKHRRPDFRDSEYFQRSQEERWPILFPCFEV